MHRALLLLFACTTRLLAWASTDQLVGEYDPIQKRDHWPKGLYELLLDPTRKVGWQSWFSECPNDIEQYAFAVRTTADAQRLLDLLAKVDSPKRVVILDPGRGPRGLGEWQPQAKGREWGAEVSVGNAAVLRAWFQNLTVSKDGKRRFGSTVIEKAPDPMPPTLRLYLGTARIDPAALIFPKAVTVEVIPTSQWPGNDYENQVAALKALAAARKDSLK